MLTIKTKTAGCKELIPTMISVYILKTCVSVMVIVLATFFSTSIFAQNDKDTAKSDLISNGDDIGQQMFEYSRPGKYHQLLADLVGTWTFKGRRFPLNPDSSKERFDLFGSHVRKPFADGRYFVVDITMGDSLHKVLIPVQDGKTKDVIGKGIAIEGYDNVKKKIRTNIYHQSHWK